MEFLPFAKLVSEARERQGLSLNGVARGMHAAARREGSHCGVTRQTILGYQRGRIPHSDALRWLAAAVGLPLGEMIDAARRQRRYRQEQRLLASIDTHLGKPPCGTLDEDVERREVLLLMGRAATTGLFASTLGRLPASASTTPVDAEGIEAAGTVARSYHRLWPTTAAEDLRELALGHLRLVSRLLSSANSERDQVRLAAAATDTALLAAWLAEDLCDPDSVRRHFHEARLFAERARDSQLQAFVACTMSEWAVWGTGSGAEAVKLVQEARRLLPRNAPPAAYTYLAAREATAYATAHNEPAMSSALLRAEESLDKTDGPSEATWPWLFPINHHNEVNRFRGFAAVSLKLPAMAVPALSEGLEQLGPAPTKRRAHTLGKLAEAYCQTGDVEQACDLGTQAFAIGSQLRDTWSLMAVRNVRVQLIPMETTKAVRAFDDRVVSTLLTMPR